MRRHKIYINNLPKNCWECPCFKNDLEFSCGLSDGTQDYFKDEIDGENCPLKSIKNHDRELVKEVCEKIRKDLSSKFIYFEGKKEFYKISDVFEILDQIQKEVDSG